MRSLVPMKSPARGESPQADPATAPTRIDTPPAGRPGPEVGDPAEREFREAMDAYKRRHGRPFPTWSEVLEVLVGLGYAKGRGAGPPPRRCPS